MDSFYGGKPGISFVLKAAFPSVEDMIKAFKGGPNYTECWDNEYCIIDTINKNHKDNGKIYRRGMNYQNNMGGAVYVGQIVGPSSGTPYFQMNDLKQVQEYAKTPADGVNVHKRYPTGLDSNGKYIISENGNGSDLGTFKLNKTNALIPGKYEENGIEKFNDDINYQWCNIREDNADADSWFYVGFEIPYLVTDYITHSVSQYDENGNFEDEVTTIDRIDDKTHPFYAKYNIGVPKGIKGDTLRNVRIITPKVGDKIYPPEAITIDSKTGKASVSGDNYAGFDADVAGQRKILVIDYYIYDKTITPAPIMIYLGDYNVVESVEVADNGTVTFGFTHEDDSVFDKKIRWINQIALTNGNGSAGGHFTFTYNNDRNGDGKNDTAEFDVSWIKNLQIIDDGSIEYTFAGTPTSPIGNKISEGVYRVEDFLTWISAVNLDSTTGVFTVTNNRSETMFNTTLDWIRDIVLDEDGTVHLIHTANNRDEVLANKIKWVTGVSLNQSTGVFTMNFNNGDPLVQQLDWVDKVYINEATGEIAIHHTDNSKNTTDTTGANPRETLDAKLKLITSAECAANGVVTFVCNTGEKIQLIAANGTGTPFQIKTVTDIRLNTGIKEHKQFQIKYNTLNDPVLIGDPINIVKDMVVRPSDFHLLVLFTDPLHRYPFGKKIVTEDRPLTAGEIAALKDGKDYAGVSWTTGITPSNNDINGGKPYDSEVYWRDYGAIKDQAGVLVGFDLTRADIGEGVDIIDYLNKTYPSGLTGADNQPGGKATEGKIITFSEKIIDDAGTREPKEFYAYDYNKGMNADGTGNWFYLGSIADSGYRDVKLAIGAVTSDTHKKLNSEGILFQATAMPALSTLPSFWDKDYVGA